MNTGEGIIDHFLANSERFENLGSLIGIEDGYPHFGHDFEEAFFEGFAVVRHRKLRCHVLAKFVFCVGGDDLSNGGIAEIWTNRGGAKSEEARDLVGVACFSGVDDK